MQIYIEQEIKLLEQSFECLLEEERTIQHYQDCAEATHKLQVSLNQLMVRLQEKIEGKL